MNNLKKRILAVLTAAAVAATPVISYAAETYAEDTGREEQIPDTGGSAGEETESGRTQDTDTHQSAEEVIPESGASSDDTASGGSFSQSVDSVTESDGSEGTSSGSGSSSGSDTSVAADTVTSSSSSANSSAVTGSVISIAISADEVVKDPEVVKAEKEDKEVLTSDGKSKDGADTETAADWEATLPALSGDVARDVIAIAQSQIGYRESTVNYRLNSAGKKKGYTRYGAWYGMPYDDWCAMFASFCLHYAGVTNFPLNSSCYAWTLALDKMGLYHPVSEGYVPGVGDLIFFNNNSKDGKPVDHVGIVEKVENGTVYTIEGNCSNMVRRRSYSLDYMRIVGYGELPGHIKTITVSEPADIETLIKNMTLEEKVSQLFFTDADQASGLGATVLEKTGSEMFTEMYQAEGCVTRCLSDEGLPEDTEAVTDASLEELYTDEFASLAEDIEAGADFVVVGNLSAPDAAPEGDTAPASMSSFFVTEVIRGSLGYDGVITTDAYNTGTITGAYEAGEAAVNAIEAGVDLILMPADYEAAFNAVLAAVGSGEITEERIDESLRRIFRVMYWNLCTDHVYADPEEVLPGCYVPGYSKYTCTVCGASKIEYSAAGHDLCISGMGVRELTGRPYVVYKCSCGDYLGLADAESLEADGGDSFLLNVWAKISEDA